MESLDAFVEGQPEVGDQRLPLLVKENVAGLQIAMNEPFAMGERHRLGDRGQQLGGSLRSEGARLDERGKVSPRHVSLHDNDLSRRPEDIIHRHHARMLQLDGRPCLGDERGQLLIGVEAIAPRHLQGDAAIQLGIQGQDTSPKPPRLIRFWTR